MEWVQGLLRRLDEGQVRVAFVRLTWPTGTYVNDGGVGAGRPIDRPPAFAIGIGPQHNHESCGIQFHCVPTGGGRALHRGQGEAGTGGWVGKRRTGV